MYLLPFKKHIFMFMIFVFMPNTHVIYMFCLPSWFSLIFLMATIEIILVTTATKNAFWINYTRRI